jgi:hypothetical protein
MFKVYYNHSCSVQRESVCMCMRKRQTETERERDNVCEEDTERDIGR